MFPPFCSLTALYQHSYYRNVSFTLLDFPHQNPAVFLYFHDQWWGLCVSVKILGMALYSHKPVNS